MRQGSKSLPVTLKGIAASRKIRNVVFRPLLVDGCLTITDDGFNIYVRCDTGSSEETRAKFEAEDQLGPLPPRMRFTIAHELAHTFFFDLDAGRPHNRLTIDHHNTLAALERVCNQAAARILLPSELVRAEFRVHDPYDPSALRRLAEKAAVSPQMLVNRSANCLVSSAALEGALTRNRRRQEYRLKAVRMHAILRGIFPRALVGSSVSDFFPDSAFVLNGGEEFERIAAIECRTNMSKFIQRFRFLCENRESRGNRRGFFLTFERLEDQSREGDAPGLEVGSQRGVPSSSSCQPALSRGLDS